MNTLTHNRNRAFIPAFLFACTLSPIPSTLTPVFAGSSAGATAMSFLRMDPAAHQTGMGGVGVGLFENLQNMSYNPALLGMLKHNELVFSHANWLVDSRFQDVAFAFATRSKGTFGVRYKTFSYGSIDSYDAAGGKLASFKARDSLISASWGAQLERVHGICAGITIRQATQDLSFVSAGAVMADAGFSMLPFKERLNGAFSFGAAAKNLGQEVKFDRESEYLPSTLDFGFGWTGLLERLSAGVDVHMPKAQGIYYSAGAQYRAADMLDLRAGFETGQEQGSGLRLGAGVNFGAWQLDYAWLPFGLLGDTHHASLLYRFGGPAESAYAAGLKALRKTRYAEAVLYFATALEEDPTMDKAALKLKAAHKLLQEQKELKEAP
ncbi:MAG: PorV/PorQ family protein [Elusimicrobia bacterium]|nr:PorV/PorQ family protein [Elusimicrobiota bacterium]